MEILFNELSILPLSSDIYKANDKMKFFSEAVSEARKFGFNIIRSEYDTHQIKLTDDYTISQWLNNKEVKREYRDFMYGMFTLPFILDGDEVVETAYIEKKYFFENEVSGINKTECLGLAAAYLYETLSISLTSLPIWEKVQLDIIIEFNNSAEIQQVFNISSKESYKNAKLIEFIENLGVVNLIETQLTPDEKKIHIADHHGIDKLQSLCDQLKYNSYIEEMRSMEWCRGRCTEFIYKCHRDGVVEIVLYKTDKKYRLWVQTTGRNLRETKAIAEILNESYS